MSEEDKLHNFLNLMKDIGNFDTIMKNEIAETQKMYSEIPNKVEEIITTINNKKKYEKKMEFWRITLATFIGGFPATLLGGIILLNIDTKGLIENKTKVIIYSICIITFLILGFFIVKNLLKKKELKEQ
jgi:hypothetical protein